MFICNGPGANGTVDVNGFAVLILIYFGSISGWLRNSAAEGGKKGYCGKAIYVSSNLAHHKGDFSIHVHSSSTNNVMLF